MVHTVVKGGRTTDKQAHDTEWGLAQSTTKEIFKSSTAMQRIALGRGVASRGVEVTDC